MENTSQDLTGSPIGLGSVPVWSVETGVSIAEFTVEDPKAKYGMFRPLCFSPDGTLLAFMSGDNEISVSQIATGEQIIARFTVHSPRVDSLVFSPCGEFLATGIRKRNDESQTVEVHIWNIPKETMETAIEYNGYQVRLAYASEGALRVADIHEDEVIIWDASHQEKLDTFKRRRHTHAIRAARFSDEGQQFAIASPRDFQVWRENTPQTVSLPGHLGHPNSVTFTQNGKTLVSGHTVGSGIVSWNVAEKRAQQTLFMDTELPFTIPRGRLAVSPDEEFLAAGYIKTIEFWHVASRTRITTFTEPQYVGPLAFSPIGECFVSTTTDGTLYMWDVNRWEKRETLYRHTDHIRALAFHPDGKILVTASKDGTVWAWDVARRSFVTSLSLAWPLVPNLYKGDEKAIERAVKVAASNSQKMRTRGNLEHHVFGLWDSPCRRHS